MLRRWWVSQRAPDDGPTLIEPLMQPAQRGASPLARVTASVALADSAADSVPRHMRRVGATPRMSALAACGTATAMLGRRLSNDYFVIIRRDPRLLIWS